MRTQDIIQKTLDNAAGIPVQFHAFYWGKFDLLDIHNTERESIFAIASSQALDFKLSHREGKIYLHQSDLEPILIAEGIDVLFRNPQRYRDQLIYDARSGFEELFTPAQMYISDFRDPEDFEEVDAYLDLIKGINKHFDSLFGLLHIEGKEIGHHKRIHLQLEDIEWTIDIEKELFDTQVLLSLNQLLLAKGLHNETLHLSIDPQMNMLILKLDQPALESATRMGIIV